MFASIPLINWFFNSNSSVSHSEKTSDNVQIEHFNEKSPVEESNSIVRDGYKNTISSILDNFDDHAAVDKEIRLRKKKEKVCVKCKMCMSIADLNASEDITSSNDSFSEDGDEKRESDDCHHEEDVTDSESSNVYVDENEAVFAVLLNKNILGYIEDSEKIINYVETIKKGILSYHKFKYDTKYYWEEVLPLDLNETRVLKINLMTYGIHDIVHYASIEDSIEIIKMNGITLK